MLPAMQDSEKLVVWFSETRRKLPWRGSRRDPYAVLVSEFMLQQTQVDRVVPRFLSFVESFPSFESLALATEEDVLAAWSGLGYYRRAKQLHSLARLVNDLEGGLPQSALELQALPGIGPYTAAAIASLAFGEATPVLDGNVFRVAARVLLIEDDPRSKKNTKRIEAWVVSMFENLVAAEINEALMELGAMICTPKSPACAACPLQISCCAFDAGRVEQIPPPRKTRRSEKMTWVAACWLDSKGDWLLRPLEGWGILNGLWLPAITTLEAQADPIVSARALVSLSAIHPGRLLPAVKHSITHRRITVYPVLFLAEGAETPGDQWQWRDPSSPDLATSSLLGKLVKLAG